MGSSLRRKHFIAITLVITATPGLSYLVRHRKAPERFFATTPATVLPTMNYVAKAVRPPTAIAVQGSDTTMLMVVVWLVKKRPSFIFTKT